MIKNDFFEFIIKVQSICRIGLKFSKDPYAIENYQELNELSTKMLENFENISLDRPNYFVRDIYPTPNISVRTIIFNDLGELLLVKESNTNLWSLPGGWCDLYDTPSEAGIKEVSQEAGVECVMTRLVGLINRASSTSGLAEYVAVFQGELVSQFHEHTHETNDVRFFSLDNLPELSRKLPKADFYRILEAAKNGSVIFD